MWTGSRFLGAMGSGSSPVSLWHGQFYGTSLWFLWNVMRDNESIEPDPPESEKIAAGHKWHLYCHPRGYWSKVKCRIISSSFVGDKSVFGFISVKFINRSLLRTELKVTMTHENENESDTYSVLWPFGACFLFRGIIAENSKHDQNDGATVINTRFQRGPRRRFMTYYAHFKTWKILFSQWQDSDGKRWINADLFENQSVHIVEIIRQPT